MSKYSFARCLENSYKVNWRISDVLGAQRFDLAKRWLPESLSGASRLTHFSEEERRRPGQAETAHFVLAKCTGAVLLLTACIEWFTQRHYIEAFHDAADDLDPLTREIFRAHWLEESQHAQMDHLETVRAFSHMIGDESDRAVDELIELVAALDGLLQEQVKCDLANFMRHSARGLSEDEAREVSDALLAAKRWAFIESGVRHPRFVELVEEVTTEEQRERIGSALEPILGTPDPAGDPTTPIARPNPPPSPSRPEGQNERCSWLGRARRARPNPKRRTTWRDTRTSSRPWATRPSCASTGWRPKASTSG